MKCGHMVFNVSPPLFSLVNILIKSKLLKMLSGWLERSQGGNCVAMRCHLWHEWAQGVSRSFPREPSHVSVLDIHMQSHLFRKKVAILGMEDWGEEGYLHKGN